MSTQHRDRRWMSQLTRVQTSERTYGLAETVDNELSSLRSVGRCGFGRARRQQQPSHTQLARVFIDRIGVHERCDVGSSLAFSSSEHEIDQVLLEITQLQ